jgi:hypothetical protein
MVRSRPEKKSEPTAPAERRVLPMELHIVDRLTDETGEYEIIGRPYTTNAGKNATSASRRRPTRGHRDPDLARARARQREASIDCG